MTAKLTTIVIDWGDESALASTLDSLSRQTVAPTVRTLYVSRAQETHSESCLLARLNRALHTCDTAFFNIFIAGDIAAPGLSERLIQEFEHKPGATVLGTACHWHDQRLQPITNPIANLFGLGPLIAAHPIPGKTVITESLSPVFNRIGQLSACAFRTSALATAQWQPRALCHLSFLWRFLESGAYSFINEDLVGHMYAPIVQRDINSISLLSSDVFSLMEEWSEVASDRSALKAYNVHALALKEKALEWHRDSLMLFGLFCDECQKSGAASVPGRLPAIFAEILNVLAEDPHNARQALWSLREYKRENDKLLAQLDSDKQTYEQQIQKLHSQLNSIVRSYSWRVTVPFRAIARRLQTPTRHHHH